MFKLKLSPKNNLKNKSYHQKIIYCNVNFKKVENHWAKTTDSSRSDNEVNLRIWRHRSNWKYLAWLRKAKPKNYMGHQSWPLHFREVTTFKFLHNEGKERGSGWRRGKNPRVGWNFNKITFFLYKVLEILKVVWYCILWNQNQ